MSSFIRMEIRVTVYKFGLLESESEPELESEVGEKCVKIVVAT